MTNRELHTRLELIRKSWWLAEEPVGLVVSASLSVLGILTVRYDREYLRLAVEEPVSFIADDEITPDRCMLSVVTLRRTVQGGDVWQVADGADAIALCPAVLPIVGPLPAPWAVVAVFRTWQAAAKERAKSMLERLLIEHPEILNPRGEL